MVFFFVCIPSYICGVHQFGWDLLCMGSFINPTMEVVTFRLCGWCMLDLFFVACIHPSRTWMSGSFESVWWNASVHRLDLGLYSHPKEFKGNRARNHINSKEKIPSNRGSEEDQTHDAASHRTASPTHYQLSYSGPLTRCSRNKLPRGL